MPEQEINAGKLYLPDSHTSHVFPSPEYPPLQKHSVPPGIDPECVLQRSQSVAPEVFWNFPAVHWLQTLDPDVGANVPGAHRLHWLSPSDMIVNFVRPSGPGVPGCALTATPACNEAKISCPASDEILADGIVMDEACSALPCCGPQEL